MTRSAGGLPKQPDVMSQLRYSVIVPCWNAGDLLTQAVDSVFAQQPARAGLVEAIVVDDASSDPATMRALETVAGKQQVTVLRNDQRQGVARSRNRAIEAARGELIAFLDADDVWLPEHLEIHDVLHQSAEVAFSGSDFNFTDISLAPLIEAFLRHHPRKGRSLNEAFRSGTALALKHPVGDFIATCPAWTGTVVAKKIAITRVGGFRESLALAEDVHLWIRLASVGHYAFSPCVTALYRDTPGSLTNGNHKTDQDKWLAEALLDLLGAPEISPGPHVNFIKRQIAVALKNHAYACRKSGNHQVALQSAARAVRLDWRDSKSYAEVAKALLRLR